MALVGGLVMTRRQPAKLMLATAHGVVGNEEDLIIIHRGSQGIRCHSNMDTDRVVALLQEFGFAMCQAPRKERHDA